MVGVTHVVEPATQFHVGILADDEGREAVFQLLHDIFLERGLRVFSVSSGGRKLLSYSDKDC